jgi:hypothetical protein
MSTHWIRIFSFTFTNPSQEIWPQFSSEISMKDLYANSSKSYIYKMFVVVQYCPYNFMTLLREVADRMCLVLRKKEETKITTRDEIFCIV